MITNHKTVDFALQLSILVNDDLCLVSNGVALSPELLVLVPLNSGSNQNLLGAMDDCLDVLSLALDVLLDACVVVGAAPILLVEQQLLLLQLADHIMLL